MANGDGRTGFGWVGGEITGSAGPYNPPGSGAGGGGGITGGASGSSGGAGMTGAAAAAAARAAANAAIYSGSAGPYNPYPGVTGDAGAYDPFTGDAGAYDGDNQLSYSQFFSGNNQQTQFAPNPSGPNPSANMAPYLMIGLVALVAVIALRK